MPQAAWYSTGPEPENTYSSVLECNRYMLENEVACDVTFIVSPADGGEERIKAHRYMLISRNPVFRVMFCGGMAEVGEINVPDVQPSALRKIIRYIYYETIELSEEDIFDVLYAAKKYMAKQLVTMCLDFLSKYMRVENVCTILNYASFYEETGLENLCMKLISSKTRAVVEAEDYLNLTKESMRKVIQLQTVNLPETEIVKMSLNWAEAECLRAGTHYDPSCLHQYLGEAFYHLRFPSLEKNQLQTLVLGTGLLDQMEEELISDLIEKKVAVRECKFLTTPRKMREAGEFVCDMTSSLTSSVIMDDKRAKIHYIKVDEDISIEGLDVVDYPGSYLNGLYIAIVQNNTVIFRTGFKLSAGRKETHLGRVVPVHLPKHIPVKAGEFQIHLTFKCIGNNIGCCSPKEGTIDVKGINFEVSCQESFHICNLRFFVE